MAETRRPLHVREGWVDEAVYDALHEGVPEWLRASLTTWVRDQLTRPARFGTPGDREVKAEPLREIERTLPVPFDWDHGAWSPLQLLLSWSEQNPRAFLTVVDILLGRLTGTVGQDQAAERLEAILAQGGSTRSPSLATAPPFNIYRVSFAIPP